MSNYGYLALFVLCLLQSCCIPTSSELVLGFAGALASEGRLNPIEAVAIGTAGEVVGAYLAWAVGRRQGRNVVDRYGKYVLLSQADLDRAEHWYRRHERSGVFGARLLPVLRSFSAVPAGIAEVPPLPFGLLTAAGSGLWLSAWVAIGYALGGRWRSVVHGFNDAGYVLAIVVAAVAVLGVAHRYRSFKAASSPAVGERRAAE